VDAGSGSGVVAGTAAVRAEVPWLRGGGAEDGDALSPDVEAGHGLARGFRLCPKAGRESWLPFAPLAVAERGAVAAELAGEVAGGDLLRAAFGRTPAVVLLSLGNITRSAPTTTFGMSGSKPVHWRIDAMRASSSGMCPELRDRLRQRESVASRRLNSGDTRPGNATSTASNAIPRPRASRICSGLRPGDPSAARRSQSIAGGAARDRSGLTMYFGCAARESQVMDAPVVPVGADLPAVPLSSKSRSLRPRIAPEMLGVGGAVDATISAAWRVSAPADEQAGRGGCQSRKTSAALDH